MLVKGKLKGCKRAYENASAPPKSMDWKDSRINVADIDDNEIAPGTALTTPQP